MNPKSLLEALNALATWRKLEPLPDEVAELKKRIERLEAQLGSAAAGGLAQCPVCNSMQFKRIASKADETFGWAGVKSDTYRCQQCNHQETRQRDEGAR